MTNFRARPGNDRNPRRVCLLAPGSRDQWPSQPDEIPMLSQVTIEGCGHTLPTGQNRYLESKLLRRETSSTKNSRRAVQELATGMVRLDLQSTVSCLGSQSFRSSQLN